MKELSADGKKVLEALLLIDPRFKYERQSHTDRAMAAATGLSASRTSAACSELVGAGYIASAKAMYWDETTPSLTTFRLTQQGRSASPAPSPRGSEPRSIASEVKVVDLIKGADLGL
jgi:hypothetical protein